MIFLLYFVLFLGTFHMGISAHSSGKDEELPHSTKVSSPIHLHPKEADPVKNTNLEPTEELGIRRTPLSVEIRTYITDKNTGAMTLDSAT
ncbi:hypothetical protein OAN21_02785 [Alphaproteobacteria bacterium]|nr:hypothetical protein [Alphaproteobacteria bacterium]